MKTFLFVCFEEGGVTNTFIQKMPYIYLITKFRSM